MRWLQLPDIVAFRLENEGPTECWIMILVLRNGKPNKHHKVEYMGCMRNKDALFCPLSALAFNFLFRWGF
jgi:hypothetical protein